MPDAICPICNEEANLDTFLSFQGVEMWEVTLYRCPNAWIGKLTDRFGMPKKQIERRHPIHKETRKLEESMPVISPELRDRVAAVREAAGLTVKQFAQTVPMSGNYLSQVICKAAYPVGNEILLRIERAVDKLERKLGGQPEAAEDPKGSHSHHADENGQIPSNFPMHIGRDSQAIYLSGEGPLPNDQAPPMAQDLLKLHAENRDRVLEPIAEQALPHYKSSSCPSADNSECSEDCPCGGRPSLLIEDEASQWYTPIDRLDQLTTAMQSVEQRLFTLEADTNNLCKSLGVHSSELSKVINQVDDLEVQITPEECRLCSGDLLEQAIGILRLVPWAEREDLLKMVNHQEQLERLAHKFRANLRTHEAQYCG